MLMTKGSPWQEIRGGEWFLLLGASIGLFFFALNSHAKCEVRNPARMSHTRRRHALSVKAVSMAAATISSIFVYATFAFLDAYWREQRKSL